MIQSSSFNRIPPRPDANLYVVDKSFLHLMLQQCVRCCASMWDYAPHCAFASVLVIIQTYLGMF